MAKSLKLKFGNLIDQSLMHFLASFNDSCQVYASFPVVYPEKLPDSKFTSH